ncbi:MAG TPA: hypothetical protein VHH73_12790 [Verrucomicrobiae bacterium]|nr:hypothetical protein [Verrucomicrobiae bacterium]
MDFKVTRTPVAEQTIQQPENPQQASAQSREVTEELELPIAAGSKVQQRGAEGTDLIVTMAEPATLKRRHIERAGQSIGAAQKDAAREISARLASMRPVQFAGIVLVLAALAMFHPAVRLVTASTTLQMVTGVTGMVLIFAPMVVAGHERMLLFAGLALVAVWFFVHRHGRLQGMVDTLGDGRDVSAAPKPSPAARETQVTAGSPPAAEVSSR